MLSEATARMLGAFCVLYLFKYVVADCSDDGPCTFEFDKRVDGSDLALDATGIPGRGMVIGQYVSNSWNGPVSITWGEPGGLYAIDWQNTATTGWQEFDFSVARSVYSGLGLEQGYGLTTLDELPGELDQELTYRGTWLDGPSGNLHVNAVMFLNENKETRSEGDVGSRDADILWKRTAIDFTVSDWFDNESTLEDYDGTEVNGQIKTYLGEFTAHGSAYKVYRRLPGDIRERASYLLVRVDKRITGAINPKTFLSWVVDYEAAALDLIGENGQAEPVVDGSWYLAELGLEVTGQSGGGDASRNSDAKVQFDCYSIPTLNGVTDKDGKEFGGFARCD